MAVGWLHAVYRPGPNDNGDQETVHLMVTPEPAGQRCEGRLKEERIKKYLVGLNCIVS